MPLVVDGNTFAVAQATLTGKISDPYWLRRYHPNGDPALFWMLHIDFAERLVEDERWSPCIYHESIRFPVRRWTEITGIEIAWNSPFDVRTGECNGGFYVHECGNIRAARLRFLERRGAKFSIAWDGELEIYPLCPAPFSLTAEVVFSEIQVGGCEFDTDDALRERLAANIDLDGLAGQTMQTCDFTYEDGTKPAFAVYRPSLAE